MKIRITADGLKDMASRHDAVAETFDPKGHGEVACSRRKKLPWERANKRKGRKGQRTASGWAIANFMRAQGRDYFDYPEREGGAVVKWLDEKIAKAIEIADKTKKPQWRTVQRVLKAVSEKLAMVAFEQATNRKLRPNSHKYHIKKICLQDRGIGVRRYGRPAPPGIFTGRTINGFRGRFRRAFTPGRGN